MKRWVSKRVDADFSKVQSRYHISEIFAEVLVKRRLYSWNAMDKYLFPRRDDMYCPNQLKDLEKAASIIKEKISEHKKIKIIGDYDVDGIMSTYILWSGLKRLGADVSYRIPHRVKDGYGIRDYMAQDARNEGVDTIVTCDNGISAIDAVKKAKELGMTVIITDHHEVPTDGDKEMIPPADAVVNPKQEDCHYPFPNICGGLVAYKLVSYLLQEKGENAFCNELLIYAALATICDIVPLEDENRIVVKLGLEQIKKCENMGLNALIERMDFGEDITAMDIGFRIGPCLNAAGRLKDAILGLDLLTMTNEKDADDLAGELVALNEERKNYTAKGTRQAIEQIEKNQYLNQPILVVYLADCHESVAGIVAGRIRETYYRPTLIVTKSKDHLKGSGRSIPGYHMQQELTKCAHILTEFGGHAMAAGFSLEENRLDEFRDALNANSSLREEDLCEKLYFDRVVPLQEVTMSLVQELELLAPVGEQNPSAVFACQNVEVLSVKVYGKENQIGRFQVKNQGKTFWIIDFHMELHIQKTILEKYGESMWRDVLMGKATGCNISLLYEPTVNKKYGDISFQVRDSR